jgi:bacillithiol synthase
VKVEPVSFSELSFPKLFVDYTGSNGRISEFFNVNPFQPEQLNRYEKKFSFKGERAEVVRLLKQFNSGFHQTDNTKRNIESLGKEDALAVVTGQQMTLYGGPLFTVYKVLTAIILSNKWEKKYNRSFVPVFWLADEDHDFEETAAIGVPGDEKVSNIEWSRNNNGEKRVSELELESGFQEFESEVWNQLFETDFTNELKSSIGECYTTGERMDRAFGNWLMKLFGHHGLVLAGSNFKPVKEYAGSVMADSVRKHQEIAEELHSLSSELEELGYHAQVQVQESNLFSIDEDGSRKKIEFDAGNWIIRGKEERVLSTNELAKEIEQSPHNFSPNVFLRPLIQDTLLPSFAYVGGPSEIAYQAQMKKLYERLGMNQPLIVPRFSATLVESSVDRIMEQLPFEFHRYMDRIEKLESDYISNTDSPDLETIFTDFKARVNELTILLKEKISEIDPTLENTAGKASAIYTTELDKLKGKLYRSLKQQEKTQLSRIRRIKQSLFPNGNLQEREIALIWYMNKYGPDLWDNLLDSLSTEEPVNHKIIRL